MYDDPQIDGQSQGSDADYTQHEAVTNTEASQHCQRDGQHCQRDVRVGMHLREKVLLIGNKAMGFVDCVLMAEKSQPGLIAMPHKVLLNGIMLACYCTLILVATHNSIIAYIFRP